MKARNSFSSAFIVIMAVSLAVSSCDVFGGLANPKNSNAAFVRFLEPVGGTIDLSLYATAPDRKAYVVFTTGGTPGVPVPSASLESNARTAASLSGTINRGVQEKASEARRAGLRHEFETVGPSVSPRFSASGGAPSADRVGNTGSFMLYGDSVGIATTCRYVTPEFDFGVRNRTLSVWVQNTQWSDVEDTNGKVTPNKIAALVEAFFGTQSIPSDSIYAWVTNMLGDEWGTPDGPVTISGTGFSVIPASENITILLADIDGDGSSFTSQSAVVGYFYPGDTIPAFSYSNERVMFTIDSVMLGTADSTNWSLSDYWPETVISTLAHEFQHMIHFYQKGVLRGGDYFNEPTWIDELCSMQVEDLIADKMGVPGPRGVDPTNWNEGSDGNTDGRIPDYIYLPDLSPVDWPQRPSDENYINILSYYSWAYSFGAYLTRNYGGAEFIRSVVQSPLPELSLVMTNPWKGCCVAGALPSCCLDGPMLRNSIAIIQAPGFYRKWAILIIDLVLSIYGITALTQLTGYRSFLFLKTATFHYFPAVHTPTLSCLWAIFLKSLIGRSRCRKACTRPS